jgi:hypothetical protein
MNVRKIELRQLVFGQPFPPVELPKRMIWTSSSIRLFKACKRKWFWKYIMRLKTKASDKHLMYGKAFHACLGYWYKTKRSSMKKIVSKFQKELEAVAEVQNAYYDQDELDKLHSMIDTFTGMMLGYAERYDKDRQEWRINPKCIERVFHVDCGEFDFEGKIDLSIDDPKAKNGQELVEHKTASKIAETYLNRLPLDTQVRGYVFGAKHDPSLNLPVTRVTYDVVRKCRLRRKGNESKEEFASRVADAYLLDDSYFHREPLMFNKSDIDAFEHELHQTNHEYKDILARTHPHHPLTWLTEAGAQLTTYPAEDPRAWLPSDGNCNAYFRDCEYMGLCVSGLDKGSAIAYEQRDELHEELAEED